MFFFDSLWEFGSAYVHPPSIRWDPIKAEAKLCIDWRNYRHIKWKARGVGMAVDDGQVLRINRNNVVFDILLLRLQILEV